MPTDYYFPGNGTGVINTCLGICDENRRLTGGWVNRVSIKSIHDGTTNTFLAGEMHIPIEQLNTVPYNGPIYNGQELVAHTRIGGPGVPILSSSEEPGFLFGFGSWHPGVCNFVFGDSNTRSVRNSVDTILLGNLCHRNDGQIADLN